VAGAGFAAASGARGVSSAGRGSRRILARVRHAARALAALRQHGQVRPFDRMELEADIERYTAKLAALVGHGEATALAADPQRPPSWRL
jgi:hypothetical protein